MISQNSLKHNGETQDKSNEITCEECEENICEDVMYYDKILDWRFRRRCYKSGSEKQDDMRVQKGKHWKNIRKHQRTSDYIIQVQDMRNKEMNETPTRVCRSWRELTGGDMAGSEPEISRNGVRTIGF